MSKTFTSYEVARLLTNIFNYSDGDMSDLKESIDNIEESYYHRLSERDKKSIKNIEEFLDNYVYEESED